MAPQSLNLIAVVGPTASGKTELGLELARRMGGEIVSADSRQVYRRLDAGTAKPSGRREQENGHEIYRAGGVPYHLVDILDPSERIDAAQFAALARPVLDAIAGRGRRPILVGGTGLYLRALLDGLDPLPPRSPEIRERLAELAEANGRHWLHEELVRVDPEAARRIPPNNLQRVVRALEVYEITGRPISSQWSRTEPPRTPPSPPTSGERERVRGNSTPVYIGIQWDRAALQERIRARCEAMLPGMLEEAKRLVPSEYTGREPGFQSLGYPQALRCLSGELSREQALASMLRDTMDYAKRQATWFRRQIRVRWIPSGSANASAWADAALEIIREGA